VSALSYQVSRVWPPGYGPAVECTGCLGEMSHSVLIRSVQHLDLCTSCASRLTAAEIAAMTPLVVAAFAQFLKQRSSTPSAQSCRFDAAREFWDELEPFRESLRALDLADALNELLACAPPATREVVD
jgi:hypothetical protein